MRKHLLVALLCIAIAPLLFSGCSPGFQAKSTFQEANDFFNRGSYQAALNKYEQIVATYPAAGDRALFEMGIIHAHPRNGQKDFRKALACFHKLVKDYPESSYRQDSARMIFYLDNVATKDAMIAEQQAHIATLRQGVGSKENEITALQGEIATLRARIATLENKVFAYAAQQGPADRILIEKKERRLTLFSKGQVLKAYRIALGGNPIGPKEKQGDHKTPEGIYFIESRNRDSQYHLSLRISYPNESDKRHAQALGVSPGGDIMIHGIKNGFSWVGDTHTEVDWTRGCIAVTDEEIEEIFKLVPIGTVVDIKP